MIAACSPSRPPWNAAYLADAAHDTALHDPGGTAINRTGDLPDQIKREGIDDEPDFIRNRQRSARTAKTLPGWPPGGRQHGRHHARMVRLHRLQHDGGTDFQPRLLSVL